MGKIIAFDALRFIACLFIIWHHTGINIYEFHHIDHTFFRTAGLAVEIFFVLSGFLLAKSAQKALLSPPPAPARVGPIFSPASNGCGPNTYLRCCCARY